MRDEWMSKSSQESSSRAARRVASTWLDSGRKKEARLRGCGHVRRAKSTLFILSSSSERTYNMLKSTRKEKDHAVPTVVPWPGSCAICRKHRPLHPLRRLACGIVKWMSSCHFVLSSLSAVTRTHSRARRCVRPLLAVHASSSFLLYRPLSLVGAA